MIEDIEAGPDGTLYVAYMFRENCDFYLVKKAEGETEFSSPVKINNYSLEYYLQDSLSMVVDDEGTIYVTFTKCIVYDVENDHRKRLLWFTVSRDGGETFSNAVPIMDYGRGWLVSYPDMAYDPDVDILYAAVQVHFGFGTNSTHEMLVIRSMDGGVTWSEPVTVMSVHDGPSFWYPFISVAEDGSLHLVYELWDGGAHHVYYSHSVDMGRSFSEPVLIEPYEDTEPVRERARVHVDTEGRIIILVSDAGLKPGLYVMTSQDAGSTFMLNQTLVRGDINRAYESYQDPAGRVHVLLCDHEGLDVIEHAILFTADKGFGHRSWTSYDESVVSGFNLKLAVSGNGTIHGCTLPKYGGDSFVHFLLKNGRPTVTIEAPENGSTVEGDAELVITFHPGDDITRIGSVMLRFGEEEQWKGTVNVSGPFLWDTTEYSDGPLTVFVKARDEFEWSETESVVVAIDNNAPPLLEVTSPVPGEAYDWKVRLTGSVLDEEGFDEGYGVQFSWNGTTWTDLIAIELISSQMLTFDDIIDISLEPRGEGTLRIRASDGQEASSVYAIELNLVWLPDLTLPDDWISLDPPEPKPGMRCTINVTVTNEGDGVAGLVNISLLETGIPVDGSKSIEGLEPGESIVVPFIWIARKGIASLLVTIDEDDNVDELDELNNVASTTVTIRAAEGGDSPDNMIWLISGIVTIAAATAIVLYMYRHRSG